jgi:tRNA (adenine37-N6)-methyltransferase
MMDITYKPIGIVHSPFREARETPIQSTGAVGVSGSVEVYSEYVRALKDLDGFSHIILLYHFHLSKESSLVVKPFLDNELRGPLCQ